MCLEEKLESDFHFRNRDKGTRMNQCKVCGNARARKHYTDKGGYEFAKTKRAKHGIAYDKLMHMHKEQDYKCLICKETVERLFVDHDHSCCQGVYSCGKCIRGLLCTHCNRGLGAFRDNIEYLKAAIDYLDA